MSRNILLCLAIVASAWGLVYTNQKQLSPEYTIQWIIQDEHIFLQLNVTTTGWVGFGIGEPTSGSMPGADIVTVSVVNGAATITDRFAIDKIEPSVDSCQDWKLASAQETNGRTVVEVYRKLVTNDTTQDRSILPGENRVVFAFGSSDAFAYHGSNRGASALTFYGTPPPSIDMSDPTLESWFLGSKDFEIPAKVTTYASTSAVLPFQDGPFHIIGFEPVINNATAARVHHFVLRFCATPSEWFSYFLNDTADQDDARGLKGQCPGQLWGWAPGMGPYAVPDEAGFRVGPAAGDFQYVNLEVHYDNPEQTPGIIDPSGVRIYYTRNLRKHDAAVLVVGDAYARNPTQMTPDSIYKFEYDCPEAATVKFIQQDLNIFGSVLHMHAAGKQAFTTQWRNGSMISTINRIDFWDFAFQQTTPVNYVLKTGDRINHHCIYNTKGRSGVTVFGHGSLDEMCMNFLTYYPRLPQLTDSCGYVYRNNMTLTTYGSTPVLTDMGLPLFNPSQRDPVALEAILYGSAAGPCAADTYTQTYITTSAIEDIDSAACLTTISSIALAFIAVFCM
eukprot:TRINITY_DN138_c0_g2_i2.p1 TRINITY_DN138_c0_g2~~TRINITY_DN138_c0_g2_i2.p1  ORF type:complete len:561 (-),score=133.90 TRINITY_DN138_c0_g2_i2:188-1870(-)